MKAHWKILIWLAAGVIVGGLFQVVFEGTPDPRMTVKDADGVAVVATVGPKHSMKVGQVITEVILDRGGDDEATIPIPNAAAYTTFIRDTAANGDIVWHVVKGRKDPVSVTLSLHTDSTRARWIKPFAFLADIFLRLLKMLIVPIILTSIITGVVGVGGGADLRRLGTKTFIYYIATSMLAIVTGLVLVNTIRPGEGAKLGLTSAEFGTKETSFEDVLLRMVPENVFSGMSNNINMLQVIFFALLFGYFILKTPEPHRGTMKGLFEAAFEVMMRMARFVLSLIPYGVFCLLVKVVGQTGFGVFEPLLLYMLTVTLALLTHTLITLPLILRFVAKINPIRWIKAMAPAIMTAFSTSSSSMTLPVSMDTVKKRGKVSNRIVSFVQPLGATINMDGTALYECIGVIFLAQYYSDAIGYDLSFTNQITVVIMALMASIGAAGIPSAGLIMMLTILSALELPVEGAALLLAVDRPLDMLRTCTNVFSDTCGAAVIARSEGEIGPLSAGAD